MGREWFISVVIPCYNSVSTVADCIDAVQSQTYPRHLAEIILSDNGSTDGTLDLIAKRFPDVHLVRAAERGSAYARNAGVFAAKGDLIASTDSDCVPNKDWIERLVEAFNQAPEKTAAIGGRIIPFSTRTMVEQYHKAWVGQPELMNPATKIRYAATPNALFLKSAMLEVGGFDGSAGYFDDSDLGLRLYAAGYTVGYEDRAVVRHRNPVTFSELYKHRQKYGNANFTLALKHPHLLGDPRGPAERKKLAIGTGRRVLGDVVKFPLSLFSSSSGYPRGWPLVDAVLAVANYVGFKKVSEAFDAKQANELPRR